jgi:hypothetical protein
VWVTGRAALKLSGGGAYLSAPSSALGLSASGTFALDAWVRAGDGRGLHSSTIQLNISRFGRTSPCPPV